MRSANERLLEHEETRELLVGTWTGIALIAEVLIHHAAVSREELISTLSAAEVLAKDRRRIALAALGKLINYGFAEPQSTGLSAIGACRYRRGHKT